MIDPFNHVGDFGIGMQNSKSIQMNTANVIILAKQREMKQFEKFRRPGLEDDEGEEKM